ncbi:MAG: hypothetical protein C0406_01845, partial [Sideroxydans sp.]|nr:hypothetical protein [Sideroxydans sp.]
MAVTPAGFHINNTATANYNVGATPLLATASAANDVTASCMNVGVKIDLMKYVPPAKQASVSANATNINFQPAVYAPSGAITGPFVQLPGSISLTGNALVQFVPTVGQNVLIDTVNDTAGKPVAAFARSEPIFIRVVSYGANKDGAVAETVAVTVSTVNSGDQEVAQLTETGPSTGIFVGVLASSFASVTTQNDGYLSIANVEESITATYVYTDPSCPVGAGVSSSSSSLIDPYGIVFNSATGAPIANARVTLINTATGLPAVAYCDDAVTVLPQPVVTGTATACDPIPVAGGFRFPLVAAGNYRLLV